MTNKEVAFFNIFYFLHHSSLKTYQIKIMLYKFLNNMALIDISTDCRDCDSEKDKCSCTRTKSQQRIDESIRTSLRKLRRINVSKISRSGSYRTSSN